MSDPKPNRISLAQATPAPIAEVLREQVDEIAREFAFREAMDTANELARIATEAGRAVNRSRRVTVTDRDGTRRTIGKPRGNAIGPLRLIVRTTETLLPSASTDGNLDRVKQDVLECDHTVPHVPPDRYGHARQAARCPTCRLVGERTFANVEVSASRFREATATIQELRERLSDLGTEPRAREPVVFLPPGLAEALARLEREPVR